MGVHTGHDSGAALLCEGELAAAVNEERFNRIKHFSGFPYESIKFCLETRSLTEEKIDHLVFTSEIENPHNTSVPERDPNQTSCSGRNTRKLSSYLQPYLFPELTNFVRVSHHRAHAASAYYPSGFNERCLVLTLDGSGDGVSGTVNVGQRGYLNPVEQYPQEGSLGWFYGLITEGLGWNVGNGEGKTMGLAPYGDSKAVPEGTLSRFLPQYEKGELETPHNFGTVEHDPSTNTNYWHFEKDIERIERLIDQYSREDIAARAQQLLEEEVCNLVNFWVQELDVDAVCLAGGVFLNVKLNQKILAMDEIQNAFIFPNAGDGGLPVGGVYIQYSDTESKAGSTCFEGVDLGPKFDREEIEDILISRDVDYSRLENLPARVAELLSEGKVGAWFQGRLEYGPRALGHRSILADPRREDMKDLINKKIKFREPFRPFCPPLLADKAPQYFLEPRTERYMISAVDFLPEKRDSAPAVVHVDGSSRPHMVTRERNPKFYDLISSFGDRTGEYILLNTSFNQKGKPIINTPREALRCFKDSELDFLALEDLLITDN